MMPSCLPSNPITRTSRARIFPFTLTNGPEGEEDLGGKGRLKTPSSVETYSCSLLWTIRHFDRGRVFTSKLQFSQVNNCRNNPQIGIGSSPQNLLVLNLTSADEYKFADRNKPE